MSAIDGYPQPEGAAIETVGTHVGPASYTAITVASPATGGDKLEAAELGLKFFDSVEVLGTDITGQYSAMPVWSEGITGQPTSVKLLWFLAVSGAEVTGAVDLSAKTLRIRARGH